MLRAIKALAITARIVGIKGGTPRTATKEATPVAQGKMITRESRDLMHSTYPLTFNNSWLEGEDAIYIAKANSSKNGSFILFCYARIFFYIVV
jgi:hypothetical protein